MEERIRDTHYHGSVLGEREVAGFMLVEAVYAPGQRVPQHCHELANFCIAIQGRCTESYGRRIREYKPLTLDFLPPNQDHSLIFQAAGLRCFSIDIAPRWLERMREYSLPVDESVHCHGGSLADLFMKLYKEFHCTDQASSLAVEGLAVEMLAGVSRHKVKTSNRKMPRWLEDVRDILHEQFLEPPKLAAIGESVGVHPAHLAREFRKHFRFTVGEYLRRLRVEHACRELSASEATLAQIALNAGFSDQSHFSRVFKRHTSMTPSEYRAASRAR